MKVCNDCTAALDCYHAGGCRKASPMQRALDAKRSGTEPDHKLDWVLRPLHAVYSMDPASDQFGALMHFKCPECSAVFTPDGPGYIAATEHVGEHDPQVGRRHVGVGMSRAPLTDYNLAGVTLDCSGIAVAVRRRIRSGTYQLADLRAWAWLRRAGHYATRTPA